MSIYLDNPWKPAKHTVFKAAKLATEVQEKGYALLPAVSTALLGELRRCYKELHDIEDERGGMFYSVYSRDNEYRKTVFKRLEAILGQVYQSLFQDYRTVLHSFVIKAAGPESEFYLHQDTTGLDEREFSAISIWIPLEDVDETNGCLALVESSQHFFSPYRSISFPAPFDNIQKTVRKYLKPIPMKAGEILVFDNRVLHNSFPNNSTRTRVAVVSGIFPKEAKLTLCYKDNYGFGGQVELIEQQDDFMLTYPKFLIDCQDRPQVGKTIATVADPYPEVSAKEFDQLCAKYGVAPQNAVNPDEKINCNLISEPKHKGGIVKDGKEGQAKRTLLSRIFSIFRQ